MFAFSDSYPVLFFSVIDRNVFEMTKKIVISVREYRLMKTVMASFGTTVRQMTEMFQ